MRTVSEIEKTPWLWRKLGRPPFRRNIRIAGVGGIFDEWEYLDTNKEPVTELTDQF